MSPIFTPKDPYAQKLSPFSHTTSEPGFLLAEQGGFVEQENTGKIILQGVPSYTPFNPYSSKLSPYTAKS